MNLREIRKILGFSQWKLSARSGVPQSRISLLENDLYVPKKEEMLRLCEVLNIPYSELDWPGGKNDGFQDCRYETA